MSEANAVNACILTDLCPLMPAIERSGSDAISNGKAPITGNAGALARNEREARNDYLAEVLSRSEKILCAYEAVRARAPAFPVIRSDYRNCISTINKGMLDLASRKCYIKHSLSLTIIDRGDLGRLAPRKKLLKSC